MEDILIYAFKKGDFKTLNNILKWDNIYDKKTCIKRKFPIFCDSILVIYIAFRTPHPLSEINLDSSMKKIMTIS